MNVPQLIYAGDTVKWNEPATPDYSSAAGWAATFSLRHATGNDALNITGSADGAGGWNFTITATQTAALHVNGHWWQMVVTKNDERYTIGTGKIETQANIPASGNTFDGRTQFEQDLDAIRAEMRARVSGGSVQEYSIGNRSLKKMPMADLIALETKLKSDVARETRRKRMAQGLDSGRAVFVRFGGK
jgi:hypothetical protein